jgi:hypothetical protein
MRSEAPSRASTMSPWENMRERRNGDKMGKRRGKVRFFLPTCLRFADDKAGGNTVLMSLNINVSF